MPDESNSVKQKSTGGRWKKGQSGNPKGQPMDPARKEAIAILKNAAPDIINKALSMVLCDEPNTVVMTALIKKIFPDNLNLGGEAIEGLAMIAKRLFMAKV